MTALKLETVTVGTCLIYVLMTAFFGMNRKKVLSNFFRSFFGKNRTYFSRDKPLGRKHKKEIIEATKEELLSQSLPTISYIEAFWDEPNSEVLVFTTSKGALDIFQNLFKQTFSEHLGIKLVKVTQPLLGVDKREWDSAHKDFPKSMDLVGDTLPTIFVEHSVY